MYESKYNMHTSDGKVYMWRRVGEELLDLCLATTFKGAAGVIVWGGISWNGIGVLHFCTGSVNARYYMKKLDDAILDRFLSVDSKSVN